MSVHYAVRGLEIHSGFIWDFDWVRRALDLVRDREMTTLVLHQNDMVDRVVYPGAVFGAGASAHNIFERYRDIHRALYKYTPLRRSEVYQNREYVRRILELAERQGTRVMFEVKELSFPDVVPELFPHVIKDGALCANEPFWWDLVTSRYRELFEELPGLAGIIVSPGSGESRLAISSNRCRCELCQTAESKNWYRSLILAMHAPIAAAGAKLVVRDFVFDRRTQNELAETIMALPADIAVSLKNTPHDYYPTFPDNPRLGKVGAREQWVEFDCMGQYFGWGIAPSLMIEDIRRRLVVAAAAGATGALFRTDWESLASHSAFHSPNLINLYAGAALARDGEASADEICRAWLVREGKAAPGASAAEIETAAHWIGRLLAPSWDIVRRALFVNDCVFNDSSSFPVSLGHAIWLAEEKNSLKDWDPSKAEALAPTEANVRAAMAEKDEALDIVGRVQSIFDEGRPSGLAAEAYDDLRERLVVLRLYVRGFRCVGRACLLAHYLTSHPDGAFAPEAKVLLGKELADMEQLVTTYRAFGQQSDHRHPVYIVLGWERLSTLLDDLHSRTSLSVAVAQTTQA